MWVNSYGVAGLKITSSGSMFVARPSAPMSKPCGWFIQALAAITESAPITPAITIGTPVQKCFQPSSRSHP